MVAAPSRTKLPVPAFRVSAEVLLALPIVIVATLEAESPMLIVFRVAAPWPI